MMAFQTIKQLVKPAGSKMIMLVMDGLGGLPMYPGDLTELEKAETPSRDHPRQRSCPSGAFWL